MVDAHAAIRSRTVAARSVLSSLTPGSPEHLSASALQVGALVSLLMRGSIQAALSKDEKAMLTVMMAKLPWAPNHLAKCLAALQGKDSACSRRPQQDFVSFLNYLSSFEWDLLEKHCKDFRVVCQILLDALVGRLRCINPTEFTKKLVASIILYLLQQADIHDDDIHESAGFCSESVPFEQKTQMLKFVKKIYKKRVKRAAKVEPANYMRALPEVPDDLLNGDYAHVHAYLKVEGCWTPCRVKLRELHFFDDSYGCRPGGQSFPTGWNPMVQQMLEMSKCMLRGVKNRRQESDELDDLKLHFCDKPIPRNLALPPPGVGLKRGRSVRSLFVDEGAGASSPQMLCDEEASRKRDDSGERVQPSKHFQSDRRNESLDRPTSPSPTPPSMPNSCSSPKKCSAPLPPNQDAESRRMRGDELLNAMLTKQKEQAAFQRLVKKERKSKAILAAQELVAAEEKAAKEKALDSTPKAAKEKAIDSKPKVANLQPSEPKAAKKKAKAAKEKAAIESTAEATALASLPIATVKTQSSKGPSKANTSHEASRHQYMCRTGLKGKGQNFAKTYGPNCKYTTMCEAKNAAEEWLRNFLATGSVAVQG